MTSLVASNARFVVAGTDTGVGKTVVAACLTRALGASYWKPVQSGLDGETDSAAVSRLARLTAARVIPSAYALRMPASPHIAAAAEGVEIDPLNLAVPDVTGALVIECAGGLMVPVTAGLLQIDLIARWGLPVVLVARTALGTINHSLLSLEALAYRRIPVAGIAFVGDAEPLVEATIVRIGSVRRLGRLPHLDPLTPDTLHAAFEDGFDLSILHGGVT